MKAAALALLLCACAVAVNEAARKTGDGVTPRATSAPPSASAVPPAQPDVKAPLALHVVARFPSPPAREPPRVYETGGAIRIVSPDCLSTVEGSALVRGRYPLPGAACREPLKELWGAWPTSWLVAGTELWQRKPDGAWERRGDFPKAHRILVAQSGDREGLSLVIPYRQATRSDYLPSASFELGPLPGRRWPRLPKASRAQATPGTSFDDFMGECSTSTRLAAPRGLVVTKDHRALVFGTECDRTTNSLAAVVEEWRAGEARSSLERLPVPPGETLVDSQIDAEDAIWLATGSSLLHFDGKAWTVVGGPKGVGAIVQVSVSPGGAIWLLAGDGLWGKPRGGGWKREVIDPAHGVLRRVFADGAGELWLVTDSALLSTREVAEGALCEASCGGEFWHETKRLEQVPRDD